MQTKLSLIALLAFTGSAVSGGFDPVQGLQLASHHAHVRRAGVGINPLSVRQRRSPKTGHCVVRREELKKEAEEAARKKEEEEEERRREEARRKQEQEEREEEERRRREEEERRKKEADDRNDDNDTPSGGRWDRVYTGGDTTFYDPGLNACGTVDPNDAYIAAMPYGLWDSWSNWDGNSNHHPVCNRRVRVTWQGKSVDVRITDRCGGCHIQTSLDLSPEAFKRLSPLSAGRIHDMSWRFI